MVWADGLGVGWEGRVRGVLWGSLGVKGGEGKGMCQTSFILLSFSKWVAVDVWLEELELRLTLQLLQNKEKAIKIGHFSQTNRILAGWHQEL